MTTTHAPRLLDDSFAGPLADLDPDWPADVDLDQDWPTDLDPDWPADQEPDSPAASVLTAGLSLVAVLAVCAGAAALIGLAFRATLGFFVG